MKANLQDASRDKEKSDAIISSNNSRPSQTGRLEEDGVIDIIDYVLHGL